MSKVVMISPTGTGKITIDKDGAHSVKDLELAATDGQGFKIPTLAFYKGEAISRKVWETLKIGENEHLTFCALPMGPAGGQGGSNPLQIVMMIGVMIASIYTGGLAAGAYFAAMGTTAALATGVTLAAGLAIQALVAGAVMMLGNLLVSAIFPAEKPSGMIGASAAQSSSPTYSLNGSSNQARLYQPIPELFGKMRVVPDLIGMQWTQYINNEMYLYQIYGLGRGEVEIKDMRLGDVTFWRDGELIDSAFSHGGGTTEAQTVHLPIPVGYNSPLQSEVFELTTQTRHINYILFFPDGICTYRYEGTGLWTAWAAELTIDTHLVAADGTDTIIATSNVIPNKETYRGNHTVDIDRDIPKDGGPYSLYFVGNCDYPDIATDIDVTTGQTVTHPNGKAAFFESYKTDGPAVEVEIVEPGDPVTLYPVNVDVSRDVSSQELILNQTLGPYPVCAAGTVTDKILFSFVFPQGLGVYSTQGGLWEQRVTITAEIQYIDDNGVGYGEWFKIRDYWYLNDTTSTLRFTETAKVTLGRYQVRCTMTESVNGVAPGDVANVMDMVQWASLVAIIPGDSTFQQKAIAISLRATQASSQAQTQFSVLASKKSKVYDVASGTWSEPVETQAPAAAICDILKAPYGGRLADANIDLDALWSISSDLQSNGWNFNAWIDGPYEVLSLILEICDALALAPRITGPNISFIKDSTGKPVTHAFTPRDIVRGSLSLTWNTHTESTPDHMTVDYLDENADFLQRDVTAVLPDSETSTPYRQQYLGITSRTQAFQRAVWAASCNRWRRLGCSFEVEGVGRILNIGDVISVSHPRLSGGFYAKALAFDESQMQITIDKSIQIAANSFASINSKNGKLWGPVSIYETAVPTTVLQIDPNDYASVMAVQGSLVGKLASQDADGVPATLVIQEGQELERRYIVTSVFPVSNYRFRVDAVNDDPRVSQYGDLPVPPWQG